MKKYYFAIIAMLCLFFPLGNENASANVGKASESLTSYGGWVYYSHYDEKIRRYALYREKFDGSHKAKLINYNENAWNFQIENGHIYYKKITGFYRMSLNGKDKKILDLKLPNEVIRRGSFEIKGKWLYAFYNSEGFDPDASMAPIVYQVYRTNLVTKQTTLLDVEIRHYTEIYPSQQYKLITKNGLYTIEDFAYNQLANQFIPTKSKESQNIDFGGKLRIGNILADRGDIYYTKIQGTTKKLYLVKYNEATQKTKVISEIPKVYGAYLTLDKMYNGYAYFSIDFNNKPISRLYRVPLTGGKVEKVIDFSKNNRYSIIGGQIFFVTSKGIILD